MTDADVSGETTVRMTRAELSAATRERIVSGATQLLLERSYEDVTLAAIAAAAGVSHQTVLNHFESKDGVIVAALDTFQQQTVELLSHLDPGDVKAAVKMLVGSYERVGDFVFGWLSSPQHSQEGEQAMVDKRDRHQDWLEEMFADSVPATTAARRRMIAGLTAATDVYVWKLLRRDLRRSRAATEEVIADLISGVLQGPHP